MAIHSPWGPSQQVTAIADGIVWISTASHGGARINAKRAQAMPDFLFALGERRGEFTFFEEDCAWSAVAMAYPAEFVRWSSGSADAAEQTLRNWYPDAWEALTGEVLEPGRSMAKDERTFYAAHAADPLVIAAWGSWHEDVPEGYVGVCAMLGGGRAGDRSETYWLVPKAEYETARPRSVPAFVIDPARHQRIEKIG
jgi:hypothetical protein